MARRTVRKLPKTRAYKYHLTSLWLLAATFLAAIALLVVRATVVNPAAATILTVIAGATFLAGCVYCAILGTRELRRSQQ